MSVVPPLPMLALALAWEGPSRIADALTGFGDPGAVGAVVGLLYTVVIGTILGSGLWTWLMSRHPAGVVAPFSMLVPVTGMTAAWLILGETVTLSEALGGVLVVGGVLLGGVRRRAKALDLGPRAAPGRQADPVPPEALGEPVIRS
jgi:O-acetylserine/cysteine efflux transporter